MSVGRATRNACNSAEEKTVKQLRMFAAAAVLGAMVVPAAAVDISGAGATFPYPIYAKWADTYKKETGVGLNYQSIGSGGGIKQIQAKTVTFGASDMPLKPEEVKKHGLVQFPTVIGGDVPVVNLEGVKSGDLKLDGPTLAAIFLGTIKSWDDAAIKKLNPEANLPTQPIVVVHRSDGSGTTFIWTDYLSKVSPEWKSNVGANTSVEWPAGIGAKGNEGVANNVMQAKGAIGYVEYAYAKQNKLTTVNMMNKGGQEVVPNAASFQAAAANADWLKAEDFYLDPHRPDGGRHVADCWRYVHPVVQAAARSRGHGGGAQVLLLGLRQGRQDGRGTRLRADARQGRQRDREGLGERDQGRERQAALHRDVPIGAAYLR